jgi:hypothetical protein
MMYGDMISKLAEMKDISITEAKQLIESMSFGEYLTLIETVIPPSGNTIGPTTQPIQSGTQQNPPSQPNGATPQPPANGGQPSPAASTPNQPTSATGQKSLMWAGQGTPLQQGMTVGFKGPNGVPVPGQVSQVNGSNVTITDPTTGKPSVMSMADLQPFSQQANEDIQRMRTLAGIKENCSAGATGSGGIAVANTGLGHAPLKRKQYSNENVQQKEYSRKEPAKTIVGDTKPHQASGELSATLAANGRKTASRTNNGFKK